ncbi:hypothetical protein ACIQWV_39050, partial [Streptomyces sp. NPDC098085]
QYIKDSFKVGVNSLNGNPHLSEDEVKTMSWDAIRNQSAYDDPDWSGESMLEAHEEVKENWKDTVYDVEDSALDSMERSGLVDPAVRAAADERLKEQLDPSQEAIRQAGQPRWGESR